MFQNLNKEILISLNSLVNYDCIKYIVLFFSDIPIFFLPIFLTGTWIYLSKINNKEKKNNLLFIFYATIIAISFSLFIQQIISIDRPEEAIKGTGKLLLNHIPDASFPSDHASVSIAFVTSLFFSGYKKTGLYFLPFVILMLLSRIIIGVHWPFDILAGIFVGIFSSLITFKYLNKIAFIKKLNKFIIKNLSYLKL